MSTNRNLRAVPAPATNPAKPRTETEEKLWQALRANPGKTAIALSTAAGIGKSTAPKILARWEKDGLVTRTAGIADGGSRPADRWSIATDDQPTDDQPTDDHQSDDDPNQPQSEKAQRLAPGALRGLVEDFLRDNPGEFSPNAIGKALKRSSGAVHNALEKLVESGYAVRTSEKPKKYSLAGISCENEVAAPVAVCRHVPPTVRPWGPDGSGLDWRLRGSAQYADEFGGIGDLDQVLEMVPDRLGRDPDLAEHADGLVEVPAARAGGFCSSRTARAVRGERAHAARARRRPETATAGSQPIEFPVSH